MYKVSIRDIDIELLYDLEDFDPLYPEVERFKQLKSSPLPLPSELPTESGQQLLDELAAKAAAEMLDEIDNEIMMDLLNIAGTYSTWNLNPPYKGMQVNDWKLEIIDAINNASNTILSKTKRYEGSFVICGKDAATVIESLGKDHFTRVSTGGIVGGPHLAGILEDKFKVYKNPNYADAAVLVGAKGEMFIEAGYVYAPYIPIFATQLLVDADFKAQRGFCTLYAKKVVNPYMYHRISVVNNVPVTPFDVV